MDSIGPQGHHDQPSDIITTEIADDLEAALKEKCWVVCTENSDSHVLVMQSAEERM
jgi:hypothetical protein